MEKILEQIEIWKAENSFAMHFFLNLNDYPNININFPIGIFLVIMAVATVAAVFVMNQRKNELAALTRQLVRWEAFDEASAKTLKELHLYESSSIRSALKRGGQISSLVSMVGEKKLGYEEYEKLTKDEKRAYGAIDFENARFYIAEGKRESAEKITADGISPIWKPIVISLVILAIFTVLFLVMPNLLSLIDSFFV